MKLKRLVAMGLATITAISMTACGYAYEKQYKKDIDTYRQYVTLGDYMDLEVEVDRSKLEVTETDVEKYITNVISNYSTKSEVTTGVTKKGDSIVLDYSGAINGEKFSGGTATDATYTVGSGNFISDLDKGLEGLELGKEYKINAKFPDTYGTADLRGKEAVFTVTVKKIVVTTLPELNDELVKKIAEDNKLECKTVDEFKKVVKEELTESAKQTFEQTKLNDGWTKVIDNANVSGYDEKEQAELEKTIKNNVQTQFESYGSYYNITTFDAWIKNYMGFENEDAYNKYVTDYAKDYLKERMVVTMISEKEGLNVTQEEIESLGADTATEYKYGSYKDLYKEFGDAIELELGYQILWDKVFDKVTATFKEVEKKAEEKK